MLGRALRSALVQTCRDLEIVVVDDGSTDGTSAVVSSFGDPRIRYVRQEESRGAAAARNRGVRESRGELVAFLDDDDEWRPAKLERQLALARSKPDVDAIACWAVTRNGAGEPIGEAKTGVRGRIREAIVAHGLSTVSSASLIRRAALERVGGQDEALQGNMDHDLWMALARAGCAADYVPAHLVIAYQHGGARMTTDVDARVAAVTAYLEKWRPVLDEWMGGSSEVYRQRYFAQVVGTLAADQLVAGDAAGAWRAARALFGYSRQHRFNLTILTKKTMAYTASKALPPRANAALRRVKRTLSGLGGPTP